MRFIYLLIIATFFNVNATEPTLTQGFDIYSSPPEKEGGWELVRRRNGLVVYSKDIKDTGILGFKIQGVLDAPIEGVLYCLRDIEGSAGWTPNLVSKVTIEVKSDVEVITYSHNNFPWPLDDRDLVLTNRLFYDQEKQLLYVVSKSTNHKRAPHPGSKIRAKIAYSNIGMRPEGPKKTYMEMTILADPKGSIPHWLVNFFQRKWPLKFLQALERQANKVPKKLLPGIQKLLEQQRKDLAVNNS